MLTNAGELETYQEAILHESKKEWVKAMQEEVRSLLENHTYDLVKLPQGKKSLINKWVYRLKTENYGTTRVQGTIGCEGVRSEERH